MVAKKDSTKSSKKTRDREWEGKEHQPITQLAEFPIALVELKQQCVDFKLISKDSVKIETLDTMITLIESMIEVIKSEGMSHLSSSLLMIEDVGDLLICEHCDKKAQRQKVDGRYPPRYCDDCWHAKGEIEGQLRGRLGQLIGEKLGGLIFGAEDNQIMIDALHAFRQSQTDIHPEVKGRIDNLWQIFNLGRESLELAKDIKEGK